MLLHQYLLCDTKLNEMSPLLQRIAAGLAAPMFSILLSEIGDGLREHDFSNTFSIFPTDLLFALIFGAPFSVPVALMIRLRNVWIGLPLIALTAAVGIRIQGDLGTLAGDAGANTLSGLLMIGWVIPAAFGTATTLLIKWQEIIAFSFIPLAAALAIVLDAQGQKDARAVAPAHAAAREWSVLRVGMNAYTGGDSDGQIICPTLAAEIALDSKHPPTCLTLRRAIPVVVDAIIPCKKSDPGYGWESAHIRLHARDGSWHGFTDARGLQPDVPVGIPLDMERDWGAPLAIDDERGEQTVIGGSALVRLLRYDPSRDASLYVEILDGAHRGQRGWMGIQNAQTGGMALGEYAMEYPYKDCSDFNG